MLRLNTVIPIVVGICIAATYWPKLAQFVETFGYLFVALVAIWQHQIVDLISPAKARIEKFDHKPEHESQDQTTWCIHGKIWAKNQDRPLQNCKVLIESVKFDRHPETFFPVPYQFSWAPAQNKDAVRTVGKAYEVFDIGVFYRQSTRAWFRMDYRKHQDGLIVDSASETVQIVFFVRADNLIGDHRMLFIGKIDQDQKFHWDLKEYGTESF